MKNKDGTYATSLSYAVVEDRGEGLERVIALTYQEFDAKRLVESLTPLYEEDTFRVVRLAKDVNQPVEFTEDA